MRGEKLILERLGYIASRLFLLIIGLTLVLGGFQNCRRSNPPEVAAANSSGGSGNGYDGKLYVHISIDRICADGTPIESSIQFKNGLPVLIRENCVNLPEAQWRSIAVVTDPADMSYITYQGVIYVDALTRIQESASDGQGNRVVVGQLLPPGTVSWWNSKWQHTFVAKMDSQDRLLWAYKIGGADSFEVTDVMFRPDGSVIVAGHRDRIHLLALSADGNRLWSRAYTSSAGTVSSSDLISDSAGNLFLSAGESLLKIDSTGAMVWQRDAHVGFGTLALGPDESVYSAVLGYLKRIDQNGNVLWTHRADVNFAFNKLLVLPDGSFAALAMTGAFGNTVAAKFSSDGRAVWISELKHSGGHAGSQPYGIAEGPQGFIVSSTRLLNGMQELRGVLYGIGSSGQLLWSVEHPSKFDGEVEVTAARLRVRANASFMQESEVRQSYFLDMVPSAAAPDCELCTAITAMADPYVSYPGTGKAVTVSSKFSSQPSSLDLQNLFIKLEVRE